jgi:hemerythrin-like domain-containing protein
MHRIRIGLLEDHARLDQAFTDVGFAAESADPDELRRAFGELETELTGHLELEERELFPLAEPFHAERVAALRAEHDRIRKRLAELGVRADLHTLTKPAVDDLIETLRRHAEEEDRTVYRWVEANAPEDSRRNILRLLARTFRADLRAPSAGHGPIVTH